jgi:hypothetical protein
MAYKIKRNKLKKYEFTDMYGDKYTYKVKNKEEAIENFEAENGGNLDYTIKEKK